MSAPVDSGGGEGPLPGRRTHTHAAKRDLSVDHTSTMSPVRVGAGSEATTFSRGSRSSLGSNQDSGYEPSPAAAVQFDWDLMSDRCAMGSPLTPRATSSGGRREATRPIAIPCTVGGVSGLQDPGQSVMLRRRRRGWRTLSASSDGAADWERRDHQTRCGEETAQRGDAEEWPDSAVVVVADGVEKRCCRARGEEEDETDHQRVDEAERVAELVLAEEEVHYFREDWRAAAAVANRLQRNGMSDPVPAPLLSVSLGQTPARRGRRARTTSRANSLPDPDDAVRRDVGQELREIADTLPLSRSAPGDLQNRRDIWTLLRRTFSFRMGGEVAAPQRPPPGNQ